MKEIKFRAWDGKKMLEPYFNGCINDIFKQAKNVYLQYTGLKDVNGKEIYEGDIDCEDNGFKSVVCYLERYGAYCFVPVELYKHEDYAEQVNFHYGTDCYFDNVRPSKYSTIVGNIFENPELLEEN